MREIFVDFNSCTTDGDVIIHPRTIADLEEPPVEGEEIWISDGELRAKARIVRDAQGWEATSDEWVYEQTLSKTLHPLAERINAFADAAFVDLSAVLREVTTAFPGFLAAEAKTATLDIVRFGLRTHSLVPGHLEQRADGFVFERWFDHTDENRTVWREEDAAFRRIETEWAALERPPERGEIVSFAGWRSKLLVDG